MGLADGTAVKSTCYSCRCPYFNALSCTPKNLHSHGHMCKHMGALTCTHRWTDKQTSIKTSQNKSFKKMLKNTLQQKAAKVSKALINIF